MGKIWTDQRRLETWLAIELLACEAFAELGMIPREAAKEIREKATFDVHRVMKLVATNTDAVAFLTVWASRLVL
jgi:adenylosuccinate lyase